MKTSWFLISLFIYASQSWSANYASKMKQRDHSYRPPYLYEHYSTHNGRMSSEYMGLVNDQKNIFIKNLLISAFEIQNDGIKYKRSAKGLTDNAINCTGFIKYLFTNASLAYGKKVLGSKDLKKIALEEANIDLSFLPKEKTNESDWERILHISNSFYDPQENNNYKVTDFFKIQSLEDYQKVTNLNHFHPQTGDVLAYYDTKRKEGHAVIVVDPLNCVAIDSSPYSFIEGVKGKIKDKEGVQFRYLTFPSCNPLTGEWYSWGKKNNKFQVLMRHRNFYQDSKHFLANN